MPQPCNKEHISIPNPTGNTPRDSSTSSSGGAWRRDEEETSGKGKRMDRLLAINASTCSQSILWLREGAERMGVPFFYLNICFHLKLLTPSCLFRAFHHSGKKNTTLTHLSLVVDKRVEREICAKECSHKVSRFHFYSFYDSCIPLWSALSQCWLVQQWSSLRNDRLCPELKHRSKGCFFS